MFIINLHLLTVSNNISIKTSISTSCKLTKEFVEMNSNLTHNMLKVKNSKIFFLRFVVSKLKNSLKITLTNASVDHLMLNSHSILISKNSDVR